jgi:hypothetical protein
MGSKVWPEARNGYGEDIVAVRKAERTVKVFRVIMTVLVSVAVAAGAMFIPPVVLLWIGGVILGVGGSYALGGAIGLGLYARKEAVKTLQRAKQRGVSAS